MQFDAELLLLAMAPVFLACIGWEAWHFARTRRAQRLYSWPDTICNAALALMHLAVAAVLIPALRRRTTPQRATS